MVGEAPLIIARGGFSGMFPDSSFNAYSFVASTSAPDAVLWCDVQLTKDGVGICFPYVTMYNDSNVRDAYPKKKNSYLLNGVLTQDWFTVDFTSKDLNTVFCKLNLSLLFRPVLTCWYFSLQIFSNCGSDPRSIITVKCI